MLGLLYQRHCRIFSIMRSLKEVLLEDLGALLLVITVLGLIIAVALGPVAIADYTDNSLWNWLYALEAAIFYFLTIAYRMER